MLPAMSDLQACLPAHLRGPTTSITRIAAGLSGAGVYRVEAGGEAFVLKVTAADEPLEPWQQRAAIQRAAAEAGVAPPLVHVDPERRAVVTRLLVDRSFPALLGTPATRAAAVTLLGTTLRRVHDLPVSAPAGARDPRELLASIGALLPPGFVPAFARAAIERVEAEAPSGDAVVLSHNDVNPTNLLYDGDQLRLLDWDVAGPNHPYYDLAAAAVFFRLDDATCLQLIAAHDGAAPDTLPAAFTYRRRLVSALVGTLFARLAHQAGHAGATGGESLEATVPLFELYGRMRAGTLSPATPDGQWLMSQAMFQISASL